MSNNTIPPLRGRKRLLLAMAAKVPFGIGMRSLTMVLNNALVQRILLRSRRAGLQRVMKALASTAGLDRSVVRNVLANTALPWLVSALSRCDENEFGRWVTVENEALLDAAKAQDKGLLVVNCHTGVSRLVPWMLMRKWNDVSAMEPEPWLARMGVRDGDKVRSISMRGDGEKFWLKQIFQASRVLADRKTLHVAMDGLQGTGGVERAFLGRTRRFHVGLAQMAISRGVPIIQVVTRIDERGRMSVRYLDPLEGVAPAGDEEARLACFLDNYLSALEAVWREDTGNVAVRHLRHFLTLEASPT